MQGCASQVWLATTVKPNGAAGPVLTFVGDSDAHIVRGLIAILFALYSGKGAKDILSTDAVALFESSGLREHLTPQRSNGFRSMVERIRRDANARARDGRLISRLIATPTTNAASSASQVRTGALPRPRASPRRP